MDNNYEILYKSGTTYNLPIFLEADADEFGVMVDFDGDIEQMDQICNFTYTATGNTITIYNTGSTNKLKKLVDAVFTINWGDGSSTTQLSLLNHTNHTFSGSGLKTITITMNSPWAVQNVVKKIKLPLTTVSPNNLGDLIFSIPNQNPITIHDNDFNPPTYTGTTILGLGSSRIDELKKYGSTNQYPGVITGTTTIEGETYTFSGYTLDGLYYRDLSDGNTYISGFTTGSTIVVESIIDKMLTRNEHFLGFVNDPVIYSDVFVERGKQGVTEHNLRLGEIDNLGELEIYGNGFFQVRKP